MGLGSVSMQTGNYFIKANMLTVRSKGYGSVITRMKRFSTEELSRMAEKTAHGGLSIQTERHGLIRQEHLEAEPRSVNKPKQITMVNQERYLHKRKPLAAIQHCKSVQIFSRVKPDITKSYI